MGFAASLAQKSARVQGSSREFLVLVLLLLLVLLPYAADKTDYDYEHDYER